MKNITTHISRLLIISALFATATVSANETEPQEIVVKVQAEVAKELTEVKANLVKELQQQLTDSIKLQVNSAVSIIGESVKALLP